MPGAALNPAFPCLYSSASPPAQPGPFPHAFGFAERAAGPIRFAFPVNRFKNWLFLSDVCGAFFRMAAELRPAGRRTTPPGRAGECGIQSGTRCARV